MTALTVADQADLLSRYSSLMASVDAVQVTYVWLDGCQGARCKTKTLDFVPKSASELPIWAFGVDWFYSDKMALGSESRLVPVRLYQDPFAGGHHKLVLCEAVKFEDCSPIPCNTRHSAVEVLERAKQQEVELAIEQEYYLFEGDDRRKPLGWPKEGFPAPNGPYYCGVGANVVYGRDLAEAHYRACLAAGVHIGGESAGTNLSQWKFKIATSDALTACDDLWMARFLLHRVSEHFNIVVAFDAKLFPAQGNHSSVEFSTKSMRSVKGQGLAAIRRAVDKLKAAHSSQVDKLQFGGYPANVARRLNQTKVEEVPFDVVIPQEVTESGLGHLVDRRVPSDLDPYVVCELLVRSICLDE